MCANLLYLPFQLFPVLATILFQRRRAHIREEGSEGIRGRGAEVLNGVLAQRKT